MLRKNEFSLPRFANEHKGTPHDHVIHNRHYQARSKRSGAYFTDIPIREVYYNIDKPDKYRKPPGTKDLTKYNFTRYNVGLCEMCE